MIALALAALLAVPRPPHGAPPPEQAEPEQQLSDAELRQTVQTYLNVIDRPVPAARWKALGPRAAPILEEVIANGSEFPTRRAMAVDGLAAAAPARAAAVLGKLARDEQEPVVVRVAAVHGTAAVMPASQAISELRPVLHGARTPGMRAVAAEVLAEKKGGCAEVRGQAARESPDHRKAFRRALDRCTE